MLLVFIRLGMGWDPQHCKNRLLRKVCVIVTCCVSLHLTWSVGVILAIC